MHLWPDWWGWTSFCHHRKWEQRRDAGSEVCDHLRGTSVTWSKPYLMLETVLTARLWAGCHMPPPGEQQQRQQEAVVPTPRQWHSLSQEHWPWHHGELLSRLLPELSISLASQSKQKGVSCGLWWPQCTDLQRPAWDCSVGVQRFQGFSENILGFKSTLNKTPGVGVCHLFMFFLPSL